MSCKASIEGAAAPALPLLMTIPRAMHELSVSRRKIYALIEEEKLHLVRIGARSTRVRTEEVLALAGANSEPLRIPRLRNQTEAAVDA
jgi:excisionase family DNA binding protein